LIFNSSFAKKMIKIILNYSVLFSTIIFLSCSPKQNCPDDINLLPMYGEVKKCEEQIEIDKQFLSDCDKQFKNRREASDKYVEIAWGFFYNNDIEASMKRFNQAWLLDKNNSEVYWGFGNLMGMKKNYNQSILLLEKSIKINPNNAKVYESNAISYANIFNETKNVVHLNSTIENLKCAIKLEPENAKYYGLLTSAYSYFTQKDSLRKYLTITDKLDPKMVDPEVRKIANPNKNDF
jgi:tetratricopeptide (TPR) repeat protein